ncbi:fasciclin domain-containing protein [Butyricimonas synergistica]|uniref:fasciclin domain-containing protein n=1 Tax=Butyricimonas synergistica TaxID=544644 RepID=UPI00035D5D03|nr:fasciclin domain-containing protein [Butyricimonas synergistica]
MKGYIFLIGVFCILCSCEDYYHDSGLANGEHDCTMWEYFESQPGDWDSTMILIEHAGLKDVFDGTNPDYKEITFFGVTNLSIEQLLVKTIDDDWEPVYNRVKDIPVDLCREMLLSHIIPGKMMKTGFDYEVKGTLTGGTMVTTLSGVELRVYRTKSSYGGVPDIGAEGLRIHASVSGNMASIASADIEVTNGVVHALDYTYQFTQL